MDISEICEDRVQWWSFELTMLNHRVYYSVRQAARFLSRLFMFADCGPLLFSGPVVGKCWVCWIEFLSRNNLILFRHFLSSVSYFKFCCYVIHTRNGNSQANFPGYEFNKSSGEK
jgi:hypothetical protein